MTANDDLIKQFNRDCKWLEKQMKRIHIATACDGDRLRRIASQVLETAEKRRKRRLAMMKRISQP